MKNLFKYIIILGVTLMYTSCLVDDTAPSEDNDKGPNLAGFKDNSFSLSGISDGSEYDFNIKVEVKGPTILEQTGDVTLTVEADPSSTAIEGVNYRIDSKTITLTEDENYLGFLPITLLTEGIVAPVAVAPVLKLKVSNATGTNVVNNGKLITVNFNYLCFSDLAGTYAVEMHYVRAASGIDQIITGTDEIVKTGDGQYRAQRVGHWELEGGPGAIGGTNGFDFVDVCNEISIPAQNLVELYSNIVEGVSGASSVNPDTGVITFTYTITGGNLREYFVTYTPL